MAQRVGIDSDQGRSLKGRQYSSSNKVCDRSLRYPLMRESGHCPALPEQPEP